jgi:hypothetical protein
MIDYKYPTIASGATPIGSAGRVSDEDLLREDHQWRARKKILSPLSVASTRNKLVKALHSDDTEMDIEFPVQAEPRLVKGNQGPLSENTCEPSIMDQ